MHNLRNIDVTLTKFKKPIALIKNEQVCLALFARPFVL